MKIQLPTGKTINVSTYEYLFILTDNDMDDFYQMCIAANVGEHIENPFHNSANFGKVEVEEETEEIITVKPKK